MSSVLAVIPPKPWSTRPSPEPAGAARVMFGADTSAPSSMSDAVSAMAFRLRTGASMRIVSLPVDCVSTTSDVWFSVIGASTETSGALSCSVVAAPFAATVMGAVTSRKSVACSVTSFVASSAATFEALM